MASSLSGPSQMVAREGFLLGAATGVVGLTGVPEAGRSPCCFAVFGHGSQTVEASGNVAGHQPSLVQPRLVYLTYASVGSDSRSLA
jgi:hypothetical protein